MNNRAEVIRSIKVRIIVNRTQSGPEFAKSGERELNSHRQHDQPHETRDHVTRRPALAGLGGS